MSSRNKFGFEPLEPKDATARRDRSVGPMGAAVREAADSLQETTEAKVEQRRQNAHDAKAFRDAKEQGRVLVCIALSEISTNDLPRDRLELDAVAASDEMEELKSSIRSRGQKEPVEIYVGPDGQYELKKGWRRYTALSQLYTETGAESFGTIIARVETDSEDRLTRYIDMVEENVVREDLSFAEMAQVVLTASDDDGVPEVDVEALVGRLYGSLHKMKRSYIRSFVFLLTALGENLQWPKEVPRNLGVEVARALKAGQGDRTLLCDLLGRCTVREEQESVLKNFVASSKESDSEESSSREPKEKFEFHIGRMKVTARHGECRIVSKDDYATIPRDRLEKAVRAFETALRD